MIAEALFELPDTRPTRRKRGRQYGKKKYKKRVNRLFERSPLAVCRVIPAGYMRPAWAAEWIRAVMRNDHINGLNRQARENVKKLALVMARSVDHDSMTVNPGWEYLITRSGLSRSTVNRIRQRLTDAGLLATVAKGRTAEWTPQKDINERAIYVLLVPSPLKAVEKSEPPMGHYEVIAPTDAHEGAILQDVSKDVATPRRSFEDSPSGSSPDHLPARRPVTDWPGSMTTKSAGTKGSRRESERQAAALLQEKFFELRRTSTADVATRCRPFFMAGWTLSDIAHALDWMPGGKQWAHDGATGIVDVGRWMMYRLQLWMDGSTVLRSRSQRQRADQARKKALRRKAMDERAERLAERPQQDETNRRGAALAKAILRGDARIEAGEVIWDAKPKE